MMVPVKPPKVNLVTEHTKEIYVPLASKHNYGIVKIGEGILIDGGVISFDRAEIKINSISKNGVLIAPDENKNIDIKLNKTDVGLSNVDNTSDINKPVSTAQAEALSKKLDVRQSLANVNKILYVNKDGYLDFKTEKTQLRLSNNNELVSSVADTINFSSDFVLTGSEKVNVSLSDTVKQVFKSITYNPLTSELIFVRYNDSSVSIELPFNVLDSQIKDNAANVVLLNTRTESLEEDIKTTVTDVTINHKDGTFTFTKKDGSTLIVDTLLEKVVTNFKYDETTKELILTLEDGSVQKIPMSAFIDDYDGVDGAEITITVSGDNKISAVLKNGSVDENKLTPTLSAKIKNIPTALSQLTDDVGLGNKADKSELFSGSYNDLVDKPEIPSVEGLASEIFVSEKISVVNNTLNSKADKAEIPTKVSQLENDSNFATEEYVDANGGKLAAVARTGNYHDLINKVPTASKEFTGTVRAWVDDEGYLCVSNQELLLENGILILNNTGDIITKQDAKVVIGG